MLGCKALTRLCLLYGIEGRVPPPSKNATNLITVGIMLLICLRAFKCCTICSNGVNQVAECASPSIVEGRGMMSLSRMRCNRECSHMFYFNVYLAKKEDLCTVSMGNTGSGSIGRTSCHAHNSCKIWWRLAIRSIAQYHTSLCVIMFILSENLC